jgi:hypothetical protein
MSTDSNGNVRRVTDTTDDQIIIAQLSDALDDAVSALKCIQSNARHGQGPLYRIDFDHVYYKAFCAGLLIREEN